MYKKNISIVIPFYDSYDSIELLLKSLKNQTLKPSEVIIINSDKKKIEINNSEYPFTIEQIIVEKAFPGEARNYGIKTAKHEIIAFIDCKTFPRTQWLENYTKELIDKKLEIVLATRYTFSTNKFSEYLKYLTYGNKEILSLAGTIGKSKIIKNNIFNYKIRAGEDLIWINSIKKNKRYTLSKSNLIVYNNLPDSFSKTIRKWFLYSQHNSTIEGISEFNRIYYLYLFIFFVSLNIFYIFILMFMKNIFK
jgi:glycosyltransferase involved in cell wall biosynthesis